MVVVTIHFYTMYNGNPINVLGSHCLYSFIILLIKMKPKFQFFTWPKRAKNVRTIITVVDYLHQKHRVYFLLHRAMKVELPNIFPLKKLKKPDKWLFEAAPRGVASRVDLIVRGLRTRPTIFLHEIMPEKNVWRMSLGKSRRRKANNHQR